MKSQLIGLTMGDPNGIGAEVVVRTIQHFQSDQSLRFVVFGHREVLQQTYDALQQANPLTEISQQNVHHQLPSFSLVHCESSQPFQYRLGHVNSWAGETAYRCLVSAIECANHQQIDAIVTAPLCKEALHLANLHFPGHTEILSHHTNKAHPVMMLQVGKLRAAHVTLHQGLKSAIENLNAEQILKTIRITAQALRKMGIDRPRLGIPGLNPHAGENGLFGSEEKELLIPVIQQAQAEGIKCSGPFAPDSIFLHHQKDELDAVIALYHDQSHIALKLLGFEQGVNITLGLPIVRTSVDHGVAFDLAPSFCANPESMIHAVLAAKKLA